MIRNAEHEIVDGDDFKTLERRKRLHTVGATLRRFFGILIWTAAGLMVLRELDVDITPVLTGAGIIGLAVGFGAQTLVKDIISGLFLIAEDQVRIGDVAEINGVGGAVEEINLRTIVLRDVEGVVHHISNGEIRTLANKSKDFSYYVIDIGVGYDDDTDRIVAVVRNTADELMQDPAYALEHPRTAGSYRRRCLQGRRGDAAIPDQDPAAQAGGGRPRAKATDQEGLRRERHQDPDASDDGDDQEIGEGSYGLRGLRACSTTPLGGNGAVAFHGGSPLVFGADSNANARVPHDLTGFDAPLVNRQRAPASADACCPHSVIPIARQRFPGPRHNS